MAKEGKFKREEEITDKLKACSEAMDKIVEIMRENSQAVHSVCGELKDAIKEKDIQKIKKILADLGSDSDEGPNLKIRPLGKIILDLLVGTDVREKADSNEEHEKTNVRKGADIHDIAKKLIDVQRDIFSLFSKR